MIKIKVTDPKSIKIGSIVRLYYNGSLPVEVIGHEGPFVKCRGKSGRESLFFPSEIVEVLKEETRDNVIKKMLLKKEPLFKVGEKVLTLKGFSSFSTNLNYGGAGWADPDDLLIVGRNYLIIEQIVEDNFGNYCYFFKDWENGIIEFALESYNDVRERKINELLH